MPQSQDLNLISNAIKAGIGSHVEGIVGAEVDNRYSPPSLELKVSFILYKKVTRKW